MPTLRPDGIHGEETAEPRGGYGVGSLVVLFFLLAAIAFFLPFAVISGNSILQAVSHDPAAQQDIAAGAEGGGLSWMLIDVIGVGVLGAAIAWGMLRNQSRDRRMDPVTEAATREGYRNAGRDPD